MQNNRRTNIINFIFPKTCINCKKTGEYLCIDCKKLLNPHPEICPYCHKFSQNYQTCLDCRINRQYWLYWVNIAFSYSNLIKKLILWLKYKHQKDIADFLSDRLILLLQTNPKIDINNWSTIITHIPAHRYREHFTKWYNQSEVLASQISQKTGIIHLNLLEKPKSTKSQVKLQKSQRLTNIQGKFTKNPEITLRWDETILIVDDITTTNATLNEATITIKQYYPNVKIRGLVLARQQ